MREARTTDRSDRIGPSALLLPIAAALVLAAPAAPQAPAERPDAVPVTVIGRVVEAGADEPVAGAAVAPRDGRRTQITDDEGRFTFTDLLPGARLEATMIGYEPGSAVVPVGGGLVTIELESNPVLLEGIRILADRFEDRRRSVGHTVRVFDRTALIETEYHNVFDLIERRTRLQPAPCPGMASVTECTRQRGGYRPVVVYVDEVEADLQHLRGYSPTDMYLVEVYRGGSHIRAYTNWWVERAGERRLELQPFRLPRIRMEHRNSLYPPR